MKKTIENIAAVLLVFALGFGSGWGLFKYREIMRAEDMETVEETATEQIDLQLPGEVEKVIVTEDEVEVQLKKIGELAVHSGEYSISKSKEYVRHILDDFPILGTKNTIGLTCTGIVKVGFDLDEVKPEVDNESQRIYIKLPEPRVLDNYVIWDSIECEESNSLLNPIEFDQYEVMIDEIEQEGLAQAEEEGIYEAAKESTQIIIREFLSGFDGYEVVFL